MASFLSDLKKNLNGWASKAAEKAGELTREAAEKAEEMTKLGKVKIDIYQIKKDKEKAFGLIGEIAYKLILDNQVAEFGTDQQILAQVETLKELDEKLRLKEIQYQEIKKEYLENREKEKKPQTAETVESAVNPENDTPAE